MMLQALLAYTGALLCGGLAAVVFCQDRRSFVHRTFAVGMIALALEAMLSGLSVQGVLPEDVVGWQRLKAVASALLPGSWLLFSLRFARANHTACVARWKWAALAASALPLALATWCGDSLVIAARPLEAFSGWSLPLGWAGHAFFLLCLLGAVGVLMHLERTLRAATGSKRGQVKSMVVGLGGLFALRIYTSSQTLLFAAVDTTWAAVDSGALLVAGVLIAASLRRAGLLQVETCLSQTALYNSFMVR